MLSSMYYHVLYQQPIIIDNACKLYEEEYGQDYKLEEITNYLILRYIQIQSKKIDYINFGYIMMNISIQVQ